MATELVLKGKERRVGSFYLRVNGRTGAYLDERWTAPLGRKVYRNPRTGETWIGGKK